MIVHHSQIVINSNELVTSKGMDGRACINSK